MKDMSMPNRYKSTTFLLCRNIKYNKYNAFRKMYMAMFLYFALLMLAKNNVTYGTIHTYHPGMGGHTARRTINTMPHRFTNKSLLMVLILYVTRYTINTAAMGI